MSRASKSGGGGGGQGELKKRLEELLKLPENQTCADCPERGKVVVVGEGVGGVISQYAAVAVAVSEKAEIVGRSRGSSSSSSSSSSGLQ